MTESLKKYFQGDRTLWGVIFLLMLMSLLAVYSSTGTLAFKKDVSTSYFAFKHVVLQFMGLVGIIVASRIPYKYFSRLAVAALVVSVPLLLLTLALGASLNQASRWLMIPGLGLTFQTSDLAKLALIMYVARVLSKKQDQIKEWRTVLVDLVIPIGGICVLILPANFSTAGMLGGVCFWLMFVGRVQIKHLLGLVGLAVVALALFLLVANMVNLGGRIDTWKNRIESFVSGGDEGSDNYQSEQSTIAVVTGGLLGKGPGNSTQRNFLPHPYSDFIFAIIVEEYGLVGGAFIVLLYLIILYRAGVIIKKCDRAFPAFLIMGLSLLLVLQAFVNMMVAVGMVPVTGQTLPLVSMGGSSIVFISAAFGIMLSVSNGIMMAEKEQELKQDKETISENTNIENDETV